MYKQRLLAFYAYNAYYKHFMLIWWIPLFCTYCGWKNIQYALLFISQKYRIYKNMLLIKQLLYLLSKFFHLGVKKNITLFFLSTAAFAWILNRFLFKRHSLYRTESNILSVCWMFISILIDALLYFWEFYLVNWEPMDRRKHWIKYL